MDVNFGYKFWHDKLNSAKLILAPMVDQSELAWRMLSRKYGAQLCYTPMFHASVFGRDPTYRKENFTSCPEDRPLIVQFCSDDPETFLRAAKFVEKDCDGIDLNLGCPQGIAKRGHYGSFLQDEWDLIYKIIKNAVENLSVPVTAKIRVFEDVEKTVQYAKMLESAGISIITVHGRTRCQKGEETGLASWKHIKAVKDNLKIPVFANGNILFLKDVYECISETGCDGVMIAEGSLHNPAIFAGKHPTVWEICREYMMFVKTYETPITWIRGHIFKICRKVFDVHLELREKLAKAKTHELIEKVINDMEETCLSKDEYFINANSKNGLNYYQCQPYLRPLKPLNNKEEKTSNYDTDDVKKNTQLGSNADNSKLEIQNIRKKRKLDKLARKKNAIPRLQAIKKSRYETCSFCSNPKSGSCDNNACRQCCRNKCFENNLECKGHSFKKKKENLSNNELIYNITNKKD